jgi:rhodanese-related sulfurtransferase
MKKGFKQIVAEANETIQTISVMEALAELERGEATFFDLRDQGELVLEGTIPGAVHASRGMLEFYADPASPYHKREFSQAQKIILYCASGGRSALGARALQEMGFEHVVHIAGGLRAWKEAQGPVDRLS